MFTRLIAFSLVLIPFFCWQGWDDGIRAPKEIASIISLAIISIIGFLTFKIKKAFNKYFFVFFGWCVVTLFLSNYPVPVYLKDVIISLPSNLIAYKSIFYIALAILTIQVIYSSTIDLKFISKIISIVCLVMCGYCVLQLVGLDEWFRIADSNTNWIGKSIWDSSSQEVTGHYSRRLVGTVGNPSILGIFLASCLPFHLYLKNKLGIITTALSVIIIILTLSITAYIASLTIFLFISFFNNKRLTIFIIALFIAIGVSIYQIPRFKYMFNPTGRIEVLKESFNILNKKAITGYGLGSFQYLIGQNPEIVKKLDNQSWKEMHNEYGQMWFETGIVGLILLLMGIFTLFKTFLKNITRETVYLMASMAAFLIVCLTYFPLRISPLSFYGVITLGLLTNKIGEIK